MEKPLPRQIQPRTAEELWTQVKQRIALLKELKSRFAKKEQIIPQLMPADINTQSLAHLETYFGPGKTTEEYVNLAISGIIGALSTPKYIATIKSRESQYKTLAKQILDTEKKNWNYNVFYHGQKGALTLIHDIMHTLYGWMKLEKPNEQTKFLRLFSNNTQEYETIDAYLKSDLQKDDLYESSMKHNPSAKTVQDAMTLCQSAGARQAFDHLTSVRTNLLSANLSLFGNIERRHENSWYYFVTANSRRDTSLELELEKFFKYFDFNTKFIKALIKIHTDYISEISYKHVYSEKENETKLGVLCQIFIHPSVVDNLVYLAEPCGSFFSFHDDINPNSREDDELQELYINNPSIIDYQDLSKKLKETINKKRIHLEQAIYDSHLGRPSARKYLSILKDNPGQIPLTIMDEVQARIYLKYSMLMDPEIVKIITYKTPHINPEKALASETKYKQELNQIVEEIIKDWLSKEKKQEGEKTKVERLFEFLKNR